MAPENPEDGKQRYDCWVPHGHPYVPTQTASQNTAQLCAREHRCVKDDLRADGLQKGWRFLVGTQNVDSLTGTASEVVEAMADRKVDVACIQETRWRGSGCKIYGTKGKR